MEKGGEYLYSFQDAALDVHGCFNKELWNPLVGHPFTFDVKKKIWNELNHHYYDHISILGGSPLCKFNYDEVLQFAKESKFLFPDKKIWLWSGYDLNYIEKNRNEILKYLDVLIAGPFIESLKDLTLLWRGSSNQQIIYLNNSKNKESLK